MSDTQQPAGWIVHQIWLERERMLRDVAATDGADVIDGEVLATRDVPTDGELTALTAGEEDEIEHPPGSSDTARTGGSKNA